ncbi:MAG: hypothetical protein NTW21_38035 [Verrucomicrobia bacterium]|nr:hypothetical protein [Verrucomicrobiota bacterium]
MSVLLYLLPLGLIFDLVGYMPPALRLFLLYGLLALPLCLKPSKPAGWLALGLGLAMVLRAALPMPVVAETVLLLLVYLAIWTVMAPVPRALRLGVVAYAFVHLYLFLSPVGHPALEMMAVAGNRVSHWLLGMVANTVVHLLLFLLPVGHPAFEMMTSAETSISLWIAGEPFHLGPTYQNIGGFLLFLVLSIFSWDGTKVAALRTASFVLVAVLLNALGAAVLIYRVDFAADFAWTLKFRDALGFAELWQRLQGLAVLVFPAFLFLAYLIAYLVLHYAKAPLPAAAESAPMPGWAALRDEVVSGKRQLAVAAVAALAVLAVVPPTAWRRPAPCDLIFVERGVVSFTKPDYTRYGEAAGGMFGMFPEYARLFGCKAEVVKDVPATLDPGKTLVLTNLDLDFGKETRARIWDFVDRGGKLWVLGDHTFIKEEKLPDGRLAKGINHLNEMLAPTHISFNNDSAQFFPQGWFHSYRFPQGTPFATLRDDAENRPGILVGASLKLGVPAQPLVVGRFGYSDWGLDAPVGDRGYLGDFKYQPSERLGDLVLVAGEVHGQGKVLVFGDTSSFFNNNLSRSFELLRASLGWLGESNGWEFPASVAGRWLAAVLVLGFVGLACWWRAAPVGAAALCAAGLVSAVSHGTRGLPPFDQGFAREHLAVLDFSHQPNASKHSAMETGLHGVAINLLRHELLPIVANEWDPATLDLARYVVMNAPRRPITSGERRDLKRFMRRGGTVILGCGFLDSEGCHEFLERFGCQIGNVPLGRFFDRSALGQPVSFMSAWPIEKVPDDAKVLCAYDPWALMVSVPLGKGELVLIGDSEFLHNRNVEGHKNHDPANTAFLKTLLDSSTR